MAPLECGGSQYSRTLVTWTWKGKEKQFELAGSSIYQSKFQWNLDQGTANLVWISGEFEAMSCLILSYWGPTVHIIFLCILFLFVLFQEYIKAAHMKERQRLIKKTEDEKVCLVSNF